jgi:hypothetical protein
LFLSSKVGKGALKTYQDPTVQASIAKAKALSVAAAKGTALGAAAAAARASTKIRAALRRR